MFVGDLIVNGVSTNWTATKSGEERLLPAKYAKGREKKKEDYCPRIPRMDAKKRKRITANTANEREKKKEDYYPRIPRMNAKKRKKIFARERRERTRKKEGRFFPRITLMNANQIKISFASISVFRGPYSFLLSRLFACFAGKISLSFSRPLGYFAGNRLRRQISARDGTDVLLLRSKPNHVPGGGDR